MSCLRRPLITGCLLGFLAMPLAAQEPDRGPPAEAAAASPEAEPSYEDVQALIARMNRQVEAMSQAAAERDEALGFLQEQIDAATNRLSGTSETRQALERRTADLGVEIEGLSEERRRLDEAVDACGLHVASLEERIGALDRDLVDERSKRETLLARLSDNDELLAERARELEEAREEAALLRRQREVLTRQLTEVDEALRGSRTRVQAQQLAIDDLAQRLNAALTREVEELSAYRSEFFGRLRQVLSEREDFRIVGDRFVFPSEVLFNSGSARIGEEGRAQLRALAEALEEVTREIPEGLDWVLRIDGHTDRVPVGEGSRFRNNWELSTERALSVVQYLVDAGIPPERLAATGFGEHRPLDSRDDPDAYARNRRIEFKLTSI